MSTIFYSLISFVVAIFFILIGVISIMIPWSPSVRTDLIQFILEDSIAIFLFGFGFIIIGLAIAINILQSSKRRYYYVRTGNNSVSIDETLIQEYLNSYWRSLFPQHDVPTRFTLKKNKIHVFADLPSLPVPQQKILVDRIKRDLNDIFSKILGYQNDFMLSISFQKEKEVASSQ